uniref:Uncharacterized protein n=1 Tax=Panagrolaimus superbus TaxID=310955 RepID=A0A914ZDS2_9BILA
MQNGNALCVLSFGEGKDETKDETAEKEEIIPENGLDDVEMQESHTNGNDDPPKLEANGMDVSAADDHEEEKMDTSEVIEQPSSAVTDETSEA